jgi:hypothetical protein
VAAELVVHDGGEGILRSASTLSADREGAERRNQADADQHDGPVPSQGGDVIATHNEFPDISKAKPLTVDHPGLERSEWPAGDEGVHALLGHHQEYNLLMD